MWEGRKLEIGELEEWRLLAFHAGLFTFGGGAVKTGQLMAMVGNPAIRLIFQPPHWRKSIEPGDERPPAPELFQNPVDGRGPGELAPAGLDDPRFAVHRGAREAVLFFQIWSLVGESQHPASRVVCANPQRSARSEASMTVEEEEEPGIHANR